ncbi:gluconokinase [Secundilactobacillus folii]|uniref:Gluconokinase n=1 Tax=Secundilactobacillus folii TaxID=2678357 RepID=A0A7X2XX65_9LACO|nr:gluconokinase [Secundilactobacillus folii]MTV83303.1 gluconokinase [Secundilactobacillus folii]
MDYIIGIDVGTTSTKALLYDLDGKIYAKANKGYTLYQDTPDMAEEDPDEIFNATSQAIQEVITKANRQDGKVVAVSWSAQQHSLIALDKNFKPLTRTMTWADNRAEKYAAQYKENGRGLEMYKRTGLPIHPMGPFYKLLWFKNEKPDIFKQAAYWVGIKEYIIWKYTGQLKEEVSMAAATGLLNMKTVKWDEEALKETGVKENQLPELVDTTYKIKGIQAEYAKVMGLDKDVYFVMGATDGALSTIGVGAIETGVLAINIGTSAAVRSFFDKPVIDPKARLYCYPVMKGKYLVGGPINNGGIVFSWAHDALFGGEQEAAKLLNIDSFDMLSKIAATVPAGSDGLIFHPYLGGERAPLWDANARGSFFGLNRKHTRAHMIRAVLEGLVYNLYSVTLALREVTGKPKAILAAGGFAKSKLWTQIMADVYESELTIPESYESGSLAAMFLAKMSLGLEDNLNDIKKYIGKSNTFEPNPKVYKKYRALIPIYLRLSRQFSSEYKSIADYQREFANDDDQD